MPKWFVDLGIICLTIMMLGFLFMVFLIVFSVGVELAKEWRAKRNRK